MSILTFKMTRVECQSTFINLKVSYVTALDYYLVVSTLPQEPDPHMKFC